MAANALINDSRLCSQNGTVMRPREEAIRAIQMIIIIISMCRCFTAARVTCAVGGATMIGLALLLYKSPFNDIVSSRAMP